jgi:hypothetical protein
LKGETMKQISCTILIVLAACVLLVPSVMTTTVGERSVVGAARAAFGQAATLGTCVVKNVELGTGVFIEPDGSASGVYSAVLYGKSLLGQQQQITIEGNVLHGDVMPNGQTFFSGVATVNPGDGTATVSNVPFTVITDSHSLRLSILSTNLPAAQVTSGVISVE